MHVISLTLPSGQFLDSGTELRLSGEEEMLRPKSVTVVHCPSCRNEVPGTCRDFELFRDMTIT
jgi:hypothetical protein